MSINYSELIAKITKREEVLRKQAIKEYGFIKSLFGHNSYHHIYDRLKFLDPELSELHGKRREIDLARQRANEDVKNKLMNKYEYLGMYTNGPQSGNTYSGYSEHDYLYRNRETGKYLLSKKELWSHSLQFYDGPKIKF